MRFLLDQDVYAITLRFLKGLGHNVALASEVDCSRATDWTLLQVAREQGRILVTRDRDFGGLVFVKGLKTGVIYLRMLPSTQNEVHQELARVLVSHTEEDLMAAFTVVEPGRHRFRKLG